MMEEITEEVLTKEDIAKARGILTGEESIPLRLLPQVLEGLLDGLDRITKSHEVLRARPLELEAEGKTP